MNKDALTIYHNPRCSKSRETLKILEENAESPDIVEYLKTPPDRQTLEQIVSKGVAVRDLIRTGETEFRESGMELDSMTDDDIIDVLLDHPSLLQRPIVVLGDRAVIGRPPVKVLELIQSS